MQNGFDGLRLTGNTFWLEKNDWDDFKGYEETVNDVIEKHRMIAICSYSLEKCNASEIIDVVSNHQFAIIRRENKWNIIESSERKKAEGQLKNLEELYKNLIELAPDSIVTMDLKGYITSCNSAGTRILEYSKDDLVGKHFSKIGFLHVKDIPKYLKVFVSILRGKGTGVYELTVNDKDGAPHIVETHIGLIKENNKISGIIAITRDISERMRAEEVLKASETKFRELFEHMTSGGAVYEAVDNGADFVFKDFNPTAEKIEKVSKENVLGRRVTEVFPGVNEFGVFDVFQRVWRTGKPEYFPEAIYRDERDHGTWRESWVYKLPSGEIVAVYNDVTERKKAEEALRESENRYRNISSTTTDFVFSCIRPEGGAYSIDWMAGAVEQIMGYTIDELRAMGCWRCLVHPDDTSIFDENIINLPAGTSRVCILRIQTKSGTVRWLAVNTTHVPTKDSSSFNLLFGGCRDITEHKKIENSLRQSEEKYHTIADFTYDLETWLGADGKYLYVSPSCKRITGYYPEDFISNPLLLEKITHPNDRKKVKNHVHEEIKENDKKYTHIDFRIITNTGEERWINHYCQPVYNKEGVFLGTRASNRDITERKKAEEALIENQEKYRLITENTNDLIIVTNIDRTFRYVSPSIKSLGYTPDELVGQDSFFLLHPEDKISITSMLKQLVIGRYKPGTSSRFEYRLRDKSGVYHLYETAAKLVKDESGKHVILSTSRDITERKKAEDEIKKERDFSKSLLDTAQAIVTVLDTEGNIVSFNPYLEELSGYKIDEVKGKDWFTTFLPECDYDSIRHTFKKSLRGIQTRGNINPIIAKDGREILIEWYDKTIKDKDGKIIGLLAVGQDVTERKRTEEMLKESEERYKRLFNSSPELILETDEEGNIFAMNPMMAKSIGVSSDKSIGKNVFDILPSEIAEAAYKDC